VPVDDSYNTNLATNKFQVWLAIDANHTESDSAAAHHTLSLAITLPWESISEQLQKVLVVSDAAQPVRRTDVVGGEVAWDISFHCMDLRRLAWLHHHCRPSCVEWSSEKL
jgi:hypothetical protein